MICQDIEAEKYKYKIIHRFIIGFNSKAVLFKYNKRCFMLAENFKYRGLIELFEKISSIPRPTFAEDRIADYICDFAKERGFFCIKDEANNVFVRMPASRGREGEEAILLQGHTDMVCEKNADVEHDFYNDGIELYESNGFIRANGTTLGADNGVAVAIMLYILDGAEGNLISHPTIECLFTASEEKGLVGAGKFDYSVVSATKMINMDSADESEIVVGCAGGQRSDIIFSTVAESCNMPFVKVSVKGLFGGHSGEDINKGRKNANKLMGRILLKLYKECDIRLVSLCGGSKDNAIPRECEAVIAVRDSNVVRELCKELEKDIKCELVSDDSAFSLDVENCKNENGVAFNGEDTRKIIFLISTVADGVFKMCEGLDSIVEYSRNFGIVDADAKKASATFVFMTRSAKDTQIEQSSAELNAYAISLGMEHKIVSAYSGWDGSHDSPLCRAYAECYKELYGKECSVNVIHAGLECGIIKKLCPRLDIISCGPIVLDLHSPDEALNIASFERFFTVISAILSKEY